MDDEVYTGATIDDLMNRVNLTIDALNHFEFLMEYGIWDQWRDTKPCWEEN